MLAALEQFDSEGTIATTSINIPSIYDHIAFAEYSVRYTITDV